MENLRWLDVVIVFLYFVLVAWIGFRFSRAAEFHRHLLCRAALHPALGDGRLDVRHADQQHHLHRVSRVRPMPGTGASWYPMFMVLGVLLLVGTVHRAVLPARGRAERLRVLRPAFRLRRAGLQRARLQRRPFLQDGFRALPALAHRQQHDRLEHLRRAADHRGGDGALHRVRRAGGGDLDRRDPRFHHVSRAWW